MPHVGLILGLQGAKPLPGTWGVPKEPFGRVGGTSHDRFGSSNPPPVNSHLAKLKKVISAIVHKF